MAKQIILTQNDYGIELETQFVNDKKKPLDITDYDVRVKIIYNNKTIDTILAGHKDNTNGIAYIVLEKEHLLNAGLYTTAWSVVDEDEHITAQENLYYFVKDLEGSEDDTPTTDLPIDADGILNKFKEVDDDLLALNEHTNNIDNKLNHCNEHLDDIDIELKNIDKTIKTIEENNITPDIQIGTITTLEPNQKPTVTRRGTDKNPIFDFGIPRGTQGREGVKGENGKQGIPGEDGITPNITIGTVTTLEAGEKATIVNSGTKENPIFDFGIPRGENGSDGADGDTPDMSDFEDKINKQYETIEKKIDDHIENHPQSGGSASIDDTVIAKDKTWSSAKIEDFVLTNVGVIWKDVNGGQMVIDSTMDGFLREVEILGNTTQNQDDLSDIQHLGTWNEEKQGYEIEVVVSNSSSKDDLNYQEFKTTILLPCQLMKVGNITDRLYWDSSKGKYIIEKNIVEEFIPEDFKNITSGNAADYGGGLKFVTLSHALKNNYPFFPTHINNLCTTMGNPYENAKKGMGILQRHIRIRLEDNKDTTVEDMSNKLQEINGLRVYLKSPTPQLIETNIREELKLPTFINNTYITVNGGIQGSIKAKAPVDGGKVIGVLQEENIKLKETNIIQDELINTTMLATDEMYMMLEPLLAETLSNGEVINPMFSMYVAMVQRGIKTIEQVPIRYREQVRKILYQLEK